MRTRIALLGLSLVSATFSLTAQQLTPPAARVPLAEPAISPDASTIVFASGGDLWTVPAAGGEAHLLVSDPATESRPHWSPDGRRVAFVSTRTGNGDIYVLTLDSGDVRRVTWDDSPEQLDGWSADGEWLYLSTVSRDIANFADVLRVRANGGTPMPVTAERYTSEFFSAPAPDGRLVAFTARGIASGQWWRNGHSHIDESEIWTRDAGGRYQQIVARKGKALWPMWAADGRTVYFMSDRGGAENIWSAPVGSERLADSRQVTRFTRGRVLWPTISRDGRTVAFERDFGIWTLNTTSGESREVPIRRVGAPAAAGIDNLRLTNQFRELAVSPDGKKVVFVVRGEVFATSSQQGGVAQRLTRTAGNESHVVWAPDSNRVVYVSERTGVPQLFLYDFATDREERLTNGTAADQSPTFSPNGAMLAFFRDTKELRVIDLPGKQERLLARGTFSTAIDPPEPAVFSPDNKWVAFLNAGPRLFANVSLIPASGGEAQPISFLSNVNAGSLAWSPDGGFITFVTSQRTEPGRVARIDLKLKTPRFREDQFRELFRRDTVPPSIAPAPSAPTSPAPSSTPDVQTPAPVAAPAPSAAPAPGAAPAPTAKPAVSVEIVMADIRRRLNYIPIGLDVDQQAISADGKWLLVSASAAGQRNLYVYSIDELADEPAVARQLTATADNKSNAQFSPDSREIYYLEGGTIRVAPVQRGDGRRVNAVAEMDVDFNQEKLVVFNQAWTLLRDNFFDPKFNGVDWTAARARFEPYVAGARTPDEMRRVTAQMIGELNASHMAIGAPPGENRVSTGRLGLRFDVAEYEANGRFRIAEMLALGPVGVTRQVRQGQYLLRIDGVVLDRSTNLDQLLDRRIDRRVVISVADSADGTATKDVPVLPTRLTTEKGLLYRAWVEENREYVRAASQGRLGYVHMIDMSDQSLNQLMLDLDSENVSRDGVVVDVRNNNGGFVNVYAIDVLARKSYFNLTPRGATGAPARTVLGQRSLELPTVLVTNQHSLSDAEDFTEGYRTLKLGKVVGEPTAGWIIFTGNVPLIDGSIVRLPAWRVTASDGTDMEMHPRQVDVQVTRALGESAAGKDTQLDTAVKTLLEQIGRRATTN
jgi:tricorn protease